MKPCEDESGPMRKPLFTPRARLEAMLAYIEEAGYS